MRRRLKSVIFSRGHARPIYDATPSDVIPMNQSAEAYWEERARADRFRTLYYAQLLQPIW